MEIIRPFFMIIFGVIVVMLSVRLPEDIDLIINHNFPITIVLQMIVFKIPEHVVLGLPIAYMTATMLGLARMSKDFEIIAIRACGTSGKRIMIPIFLISLIVSGVAFLVNEELVPITNRLIQNAKDEAEKINNPDKSGVVVSVNFKGVDSRFFNLAAVNKEEKSLHNIMIFDSNDKKNYKIITAKTGYWEDTIWKLEEGVVQEYDKLNTAKFVKREYTFKELNVDSKVKIENYLSGEIKIKEMNSRKLGELIRDAKEGGQETKDYEIEYESKFAKPLATFFAALIAAPLALRFAKGGYIGFAISIILIFFYFVADSIGGAAGQHGFVVPKVAAWISNICFGILGLLIAIKVD